MKKRITCAAVLLAAATAHAEPRVGVELGHTLSSVDGPGVRVDLGAVQLDALIEGYYLSQSEPRHAVAAEARALVPVRRFADGWFGVAVGAAIASRATPDPDGSPTHAHNYALDAALHAEWQVAPHLSLGVDVGVTRQAGDGNVSPLVSGPGDAQRTTYFGRATGASFTYWF